jgi:phosphatidylserine/phosphatidylglycerophosphate/cardiolipin synthase-like enzyme
MLQTAILSIFLFIALTLPCLSDSIQSTETIDAYFSPREATEAIVKEINSSQSQIMIQAYSFTSKPIVNALINAYNRGVKIEALLDWSQRKDKFISDDFVSRAGIPTYIDSEHGIAHKKIIIIDQNTLITGPINISKEAEEKNAENLLILKGNKLFMYRYARDFEEHKRHSEKWAVRAN